MAVVLDVIVANEHHPRVDRFPTLRADPLLLAAITLGEQFACASERKEPVPSVTTLRNVCFRR